MPRKHAKQSTARSHAKSPSRSPSRQLILILNEATGEIAGLARIGPGGKRYALADAEIAKVAGENELDDFSELIEEAYAAGIRDGMDDALGDHSEDAAGQETAGSRLLRSGVRRFVLRRALRHSATRVQRLPPHNGTSDAGRHS